MSATLSVALLVDEADGVATSVVVLSTPEEVLSAPEEEPATIVVVVVSEVEPVGDGPTANVDVVVSLDDVVVWEVDDVVVWEGDNLAVVLLLDKVDVLAVVVVVVVVLVVVLVDVVVGRVLQSSPDQPLVHVHSMLVDKPPCDLQPCPLHTSINASHGSMAVE